MSIPFNQIPNSLRVPFTYVEFDNSKAQQGPAIQKYTALVIGQRLAAGTVAELVPTVITSESQARAAFGAGSMLHGQLAYYLKNDKVTELVAIAQDDDGTAVKATKTVTVTGPATADGVLYLYVAGRLITVSVTSGDTATTVATAIAAAVQAESLSYMSATSAAAVATLTAKNGGVAGNEIDVRVNYNDGDVYPAGISVVVAAGVTGSVNPDLDDVLAILPETQYNIISHPYLDATNLTKLEAELTDRFGAIRQNDGVAFAAKIASLGTLTTLGNSRNSPNSSIMGVAGPSAPWEWAVAYAAEVAKSGQADPAKPFTTLPLLGILAPSDAEQFSLTERNNLLFDGIATYRVNAGQPIIERAITTYQTNAASAADTSYLDVNTLLTLSFLRYSFRTRMLSKYSRHKLASDGQRFGPGQQVITPLLGRAEAIALFAEWQDAALVEGLDQFKRDLIVERNTSDVNRLDFLLPPDLVNQLLVVGSKIEFLL